MNKTTIEEGTKYGTKELLRDLAPTIITMLIIAIGSIAMIMYTQYNERQYQETHKHELINGGP